MVAKPPVLLHPSPNRNARGVAIDCIVVHTTEGKIAAALDWFGRPESKASAHFVVAQDGRIFQCVDESMAAWHAGNAVVNHRSIGIELEGHCEIPAMFTGPLMDSLGALCRYLCATYQIPADRAHIFGHCDVPTPHHPGEFGGANHHTDPGPFFKWADLFDRLRSLNPPPAGEAGIKE